MDELQRDSLARGDSPQSSWGEYILSMGQQAGTLGGLLEAYGYETMQVENGEAASSWLRARALAQAWASEVKVSTTYLPKAIICDLGPSDKEAYGLLAEIRGDSFLRRIPFIVLAHSGSEEEKLQALKAGFDDYYPGDIESDALHSRIVFLNKLKVEQSTMQSSELIVGQNLRITRGKRIFDILTSVLLLFILSPLMAGIALLIKLTSRGPVIHVAKRAGAGYEIFDFYQFRTAHQVGDRVADAGAPWNQQHAWVDENGKLSFGPVDADDERLTPLGEILRKTSLDELPQLFNVLKGDMSIVGNRPLPLQQAQLLTTDQWALRFLAPAGITGLWQVTRRSKHASLSEIERENLDIAYARHTSFWMDIRILIKTIPAMLSHK